MMLNIVRIQDCNLVSEPAEVLANVIIERINRKIESILDDNQFDFRKGRRTCKPTGYMKILTARVLEVDHEMFVFYRLGKSF